jgi:hypothetical protein
MKARILFTAAAAGLLCAPLLDAQTAKPAAKAASPWARVPALTTACYQDGDPWGEQFSATFYAVQQDHYRQNDINSELSQQVTDASAAEDPFALAQRMTQAMLDDPQNAQKLIEATQQSEQTRDEVLPTLDKENRIKAESKTLLKQYKDEYAKALGPGNARQAALNKKVAASGYMGEGYPDWAYPEYHAVLKDWDNAYAAHCAKWWSATGPMHAYLKRYKDFLVLERTPQMKKLDEQKLLHFETYGVDASRWRSTADFDAVEDYMSMAIELFGQRQIARQCQALAGNYQCQ